jgi:hypothetical protein
MVIPPPSSSPNATASHFGDARITPSKVHPQPCGPTWPPSIRRGKSPSCTENARCSGAAGAMRRFRGCCPRAYRTLPLVQRRGTMQPHWGSSPYTLRHEPCGQWCGQRRVHAVRIRRESHRIGLPHGGKKPRMAGVGDHEFRQLVDAAGVTASAEEAAVLQRLPAFVKFAGRYPIPPTPEQMKPSRSGTVPGSYRRKN